MRYDLGVAFRHVAEHGVVTQSVLARAALHTGDTVAPHSARAAQAIAPQAERNAPRLVPIEAIGDPKAPAAVAPAPVPAMAAAPARSIEDVVARAAAAVVAIETSSGRGTGFFVTPTLLVVRGGRKDYRLVRAAGSVR